MKKQVVLSTGIRHRDELHAFLESYIDQVKHCLRTLDTKKLAMAIDMLMEAYLTQKTVYIIGNGGSASTASHMACDLGKGTLQRVYDREESRFRVISLTDNNALITALANDLSYTDIFLQQLRNLVKKDDVVIALSGSGNSPNVIKAVRYANTCGAKTIGILGFKTGGKLARIVHCAIVADSMHYGPVEDMQLVINHMITSWIAKIKHTHIASVRRTNSNRAVPFQ